MWRPIQKLAAGRLAYLRFDGAGERNCLGYINASGKAEWPDGIRGLAPTEWCDASDMLSGAGVAPAVGTQPSG